jgi:hypothetical protein
LISFLGYYRRLCIQDLYDPDISKNETPEMKGNCSKEHEPLPGNTVHHKYTIPWF